MYCPKCQRPLPAQQVEMCPHCGQDLRRGVYPENNPPQPVQEAPQNASSPARTIILCVFAAILLGALILTAIVIFRSGKQSGAAKDQQASASDKADPSGKTPEGEEIVTTAAGDPETTAEPENSTEPGSPAEPGEPVNPPTGDPIDAAGLKKTLDDELEGLRSDWQVVVFDPVNNEKVESFWAASSAGIRSADDLMKSVNLVRLFVMADVYQQVKDGSIKEEDVQDDLTAMITKNDMAAGDRLVEVLGRGDADKGRENVKSYAKTLGYTIGFNRSFQSGSGSYNYVSARSAAAMLNKIVRGECVSPEYDRKMTDLLFAVESDEFDLGIEDEGVTKGFLCDVVQGVCIGTAGIVNNGERTYVVCVIVNDINSMDSCKKKTAAILRSIQPFFES